MSHVRMRSVGYNEMLHSNELKCWWIMSCRWWNLACLMNEYSRCVCHLNTTFQLDTSGILHCVVLITFRHFILTKSPCRWRTSIDQYSTGLWRLFKSSWSAGDTSLPVSTPVHEDPAAVRLRYAGHGPRHLLPPQHFRAAGWELSKSFASFGLMPPVCSLFTDSIF